MCLHGGDFKNRDSLMRVFAWWRFEKLQLSDGVKFLTEIGLVLWILNKMVGPIRGIPHYLACGQAAASVQQWCTRDSLP